MSELIRLRSLHFTASIQFLKVKAPLSFLGREPKLKLYYSFPLRNPLLGLEKKKNALERKTKKLQKTFVQSCAGYDIFCTTAIIQCRIHMDTSRKSLDPCLVDISESYATSIILEKKRFFRPLLACLHHEKSIA